LILGDVTYGACCIDDLASKKLGCDFIVHYGHSCLVPLTVTTIKILYVFVEIQFDISHLVACIRENFFSLESQSDVVISQGKVAIMGTIQFSSAIHSVITQLQKELSPENFSMIFCPQAKPLSTGETLGCTSPVLPIDTTVVIFLADGRFHLESVMIQNSRPSLSFFRYDPYSKLLTIEGYDTERMKQIRWNAISQCRNGLVFGIVLGTLGRQGSQIIFKRMRRLLKEWDERERLVSGERRRAVLFLMAELNPLKIAQIIGIDVWVQISCPRLSIDWGTEFKQPTLTSYEFEVLVGSTQWSEIYPMDYYRKDGGSWGNYYQE